MIGYLPIQRAIMITLTSICKNYKTKQGIFPALRNINLEVRSGEIFGIIGKSGAGKSTLIRCVNLLERPTSGKVIIDNEDLMSLSTTDLRNARRKIGMIFQHFNLLASRTVFENIAFPLELLKMSRKQIDLKITPLLELTELVDKKNVYPSQLSGGQKQRVAIARALAADPKILLSDEATSALDPKTTQMILQLLKNIRDRLKVTILLITHEMTVIKSCCDRVGILDHGEIIEENEVGEFFANPQTTQARDFVLSTLHQKLPKMITEHLMAEQKKNTHPVIRFWFLGSGATQPIISQLIKQFHLRINILQGNLEYVKKHAIGVLTVAVDGEQAQLQASEQYLKEIGVHYEVLGYVPVDIIPFA